MKMRLLKKLASTGSVLCGLTALLAIVLLAIGQTRSEAVILSWVRHTNRTIEVLDTLQITVQAAETGQRGFLLTGKPPYLEPYLDAQRRLPELERRVADLIGRNPQEREIAASLLDAIRLKMIQLDATVVAQRAGDHQAALRIVQTDTGMALMTRIRAQLGRLQAEEEQLLAARRHRLDRTVSWLSDLAIGGSLLATIGGVVGSLALRRAARRTRDSETRYRLLAQNTSDLIVRLDLDLKHTYVSPSSVAVIGYEPDELLGGSPRRTIHPDDLAAVERQMQRLASGRLDGDMLTFRVTHKSGHCVWLEAALTLVRDAANQPQAIVASLRDISSRKTQADELRAVNIELERLARHLARARDRAEDANSAKTRFLAGMSHELRTPLNGILGYTHLLRIEGGLNAIQTDRVTSMLNAGEHLLGMINHVLDLSEIEAEHVDLQMAEFDVATIAGACLSLVQPAASAKQLALTLQIDPDTPTAVMGDAARIRQVLLNLLGNAVKFTSSGSVELRVLPGPDASALRFEVADTGPGICPAMSQRLFAEFDRLGATETTIEGAGLGLAISARLTALMGGAIGHCDNPDAVGSLFWLDLPTGAPAQAATAAAEPTQASEAAETCLRVLVVDDVAMNRDVAQAFLRAAGHQADAVADGAAAVEAVRAGCFDAVLMDVRMPGIDGLEAARRIRRLDVAARDVPIIALTAQAFNEQIDECHEAGMNGHLAKPFAPEALLAALHHVLASSAEAAQACSAAAAPLPPVFDDVAFRRTTAFFDDSAISSYLRTIADRGETLMSGLQAPGDEVEALAAAAHEFAGSAGLFGFTRASELARGFERAVATDPAECPPLRTLLIDAITDSIAAMDAMRPASQLQPALHSEIR